MAYSAPLAYTAAGAAPLAYSTPFARAVAAPLAYNAAYNTYNAYNAYNAPLTYAASPLAYSAPLVAGRSFAAPVAAAYSAPIVAAAPAPIIAARAAPIVAAAPAPVLAKTVIAAAPAPEFADAYPQYQYAYNVQDSITGDSKTQEESRDGDVVKGSYSLIEPDGSRRIVNYYADPINGFNAVVQKDVPVAVAPVVAAKTVVAPAAPIVAANAVVV